ncbi:MAG: hypothetical protein KDE46_15585, partial [Caldilineaceae bacterium]|nr:hypothetical protein [Caldilineaceae bacterium]
CYLAAAAFHCELPDLSVAITKFAMAPIFRISGGDQGAPTARRLSLSKPKRVTPCNPVEPNLI